MIIPRDGGGGALSAWLANNYGTIFLRGGPPCFWQRRTLFSWFLAPPSILFGHTHLCSRELVKRRRNRFIDGVPNMMRDSTVHFHGYLKRHRTRYLTES